MLLAYENIVLALSNPLPAESPLVLIGRTTRGEGRGGGRYVFHVGVTRYTRLPPNQMPTFQQLTWSLTEFKRVPLLVSEHSGWSRKEGPFARFCVLVITLYPITPQVFRGTTHHADFMLAWKHVGQISFPCDYIHVSCSDRRVLPTRVFVRERAARFPCQYLLLMYLPWRALLGMPPPPPALRSRVSSGRHSALPRGDVRGGLRCAQAAFGQVLRNRV